MVYVARARASFESAINSSTQQAFANITIRSCTVGCVAVDSSANIIDVTKSGFNSPSREIELGGVML
jgi:hypothetical protein